MVAGPSGQVPVKVACNLALSPQYACVSTELVLPQWHPLAVVLTLCSLGPIAATLRVAPHLFPTHPWKSEAVILGFGMLPSLAAPREHVSYPNQATRRSGRSLNCRTFWKCLVRSAPAAAGFAWRAF